ncbi:MAG: hypothetical protein B7X76_03125 [Azorhizobium sp. 39-67-5]|nr:MAG: hypothetical protein B7X76_03125 [Azorhizobium sp. 39-67-5]
MEIRQLKYFLAVAHSGSFTAAAARVGIAQPALSTQVGKLESELGSMLFIRNFRGVDLTSAGKLLKTHAEQILRQVEEARNELQLHTRTGTVEITIGLPTLASNLLVAPLLDEMRCRLPHVTVRIIEGMGASLRTQLASGRLDLAVVYERPLDDLEAAETILEEDLYVIATANISQPTGPDFPARRLNDLPLVLSMSGNSHRDQIEALLCARGARLNLQAEVDSISGQRELVLAGVGATILPLSGIREWPQENLRYARLRDPDLVSRMLVVSNPHAAYLEVQQIRRVLKDVIARIVESGRWIGGRVNAEPVHVM